MWYQNTQVSLSDLTTPAPSLHLTPGAPRDPAFREIAAGAEWALEPGIQFDGVGLGLGKCPSSVITLLSLTPVSIYDTTPVLPFPHHLSTPLSFSCLCLPSASLSSSIDLQSFMARGLNR